MYTVLEKILSGVYDNPNLPIPPDKPILFTKKASELLPEEIRQVSKVQEEYDKELAIYSDKMIKYRAALRNIETNFKADLEKECGVGHHSKRHKLWDIAWARYSQIDLKMVYKEYVELSSLLV